MIGLSDAVLTLISRSSCVVMKGASSKKPAGPSSGPFLTLAETADYLRVNPSTIYRLLKRKELPAFKVGKDWRFNIEALDEWRFRIEKRMNTTKKIALDTN